MALRTLLDFVLHSGSKSILGPVLLLARENALVEELGILLASIEGIVAHELVVGAALRAAVASRLTVLAATWRVPNACAKVDGIIFNCFELIIFIHSLIVHVVLVVAHWVALIKVRHLANASPVLVVIGAAPVQVLERNAVGSTILRVQTAMPLWQSEAEALVEVARGAYLTAVLVLVSLLHFVLFVGDSTFVEAAVYHSSIVIARAVLEVLRLVY
jgi:hypothetical protein